MSIADPSQRADQRALAAIALELLRAGVGARMTTSVEIQGALEVGSGTVQKARRSLVASGAVRLRARGHQGTFIEALDPALMWRAAELPPLRLLLPPPGSLESAAIALGIRDQFGRAQLGVEFDFVGGSRRRIALLDESSDPVAVVVSRGAARGLGLLDDPAYASLDLGPESYYQADSLVVLRRDGGPARRIARDPDSFDHAAITDNEFRGRDVEYVDCPFVQVPAAILEGHADAGVWHRVVSVITPRQAGLRVEPLTRDLRGADGAPDVADALLVWRAAQREIDALAGLVDVPRIAERRRELVGIGVDSPEISQHVPWL